MNAAGAGVGADEVEDPVAPCEVEVAAAEEVDPGFFEPEFADQEVGDVVCEGGGLELGVVLSVFDGLLIGLDEGWGCLLWFQSEE